MITAKTSLYRSEQQSMLWKTRWRVAAEILSISSVMHFFKTSAGGGDIVNSWSLKNPHKKKSKGVRLGL